MWLLCCAYTGIVLIPTGCAHCCSHLGEGECNISERVNNSLPALFFPGGVFAATPSRADCRAELADFAPSRPRRRHRDPTRLGKGCGARTTCTATRLQARRRPTGPPALGLLHWPSCTGPLALALLHWASCTGPLALALLTRPLALALFHWQSCTGLPALALLH